MGLTITILGRQWPARYSLRAAMAVSDKYGDIRKALFETGESDSERILARIFVLRELLKAGKAWVELEEAGSAAEPPTEEQLLDMIASAKSGAVMEQMIRVINDDEKSDFETEEPDDRKNPQAT